MSALEKIVGDRMKLIGCIIMALFLGGCASQEMMMVRQMEIQNVDINDLQDGEYIGSFTYSGFEYRVRTTVDAHRITNIEILKNRNTKHAKQAEAVVIEIINRQTPNVDAVSGATTTSKALMKAVENSLVKLAPRP
jgi:uncharacterized protein with FMN-binding domain